MAALLLSNGPVLVGGALADGLAVRIEAGRIAGVGPVEQMDGDAAQRIDLAGRILVPGFVDIQVNGGGGRMFQDAPSLGALAGMVAAHRPFGTVAMLPTLITSDIDTMRRAADAVSEALSRGLPGIAGIHFEGPLLNPARRGVHDAALFRREEAILADILTSMTAGRTMVTLAPECVDVGFIRHLADHGVLVSIGHTDCTFEQAQAAFAAGAICMTHLFNAMPPMLGRVPGPIAAALTDDRIYCGLIADGHHVSPAALKVGLRAMGHGRAILVTDAMADVGEALSDFFLGSERIHYAGGRLTTADGTLAGSALSMVTAVRNAVAMLDVPLADALAMASTNPAGLLSLDGRSGGIRAGNVADLAILTADLTIDAMIVEGEWTDVRLRSSEVCA